jgi:hypothetical protein
MWAIERIGALLEVLALIRADSALILDLGA